MNFKPPTTIESFLSELSEDLQIIGLIIVDKERKRFKQGNFTSEEEKMFKFAHDLACEAAKRSNEIAIEIFKKESQEKG